MTVGAQNFLTDNKFSPFQNLVLFFLRLYLVGEIKVYQVDLYALNLGDREH